MYYVYVLSLDCIGGKEFYIGYTSDLKRRMIGHGSGNTRSTKNRNPILIYYEAYDDKYLALKREKGLKDSGSVYMSL
ncbi:MAG: GIY-YIG nuclease family protein, partial [bacterium]|nr:GIY-YIG nuclease family protein [bacterium]